MSYPVEVPLTYLFVEDPTKQSTSPKTAFIPFSFTMNVFVVYSVADRENEELCAENIDKHDEP